MNSKQLRSVSVSVISGELTPKHVNGAYNDVGSDGFAPTFSALKGGVTLQVASWKVLRYRGGCSYTVACRTIMGHLAHYAVLVSDRRPDHQRFSVRAGEHGGISRTMHYLTFPLPQDGYGTAKTLN